MDCSRSVVICEASLAAAIKPMWRAFMKVHLVRRDCAGEGRATGARLARALTSGGDGRERVLRVVTRLGRATSQTVLLEHWHQFAVEGVLRLAAFVGQDERHENAGDTADHRCR